MLLSPPPFDAIPDDGCRFLRRKPLISCSIIIWGSRSRSMLASRSWDQIEQKVVHGETIKSSSPTEATVVTLIRTSQASLMFPGERITFEPHKGTIE